MNKSSVLVSPKCALVRALVRAIVCALVWVSLPAQAAMASDDIAVSAAIDWRAGMVDVELAARIPDDATNRTTAIGALERRIDRFAPAAVTSVLQSIRTDSRRLLVDYLQADPDLLGSPQQLRSHLDRGFSRPSADLQGISVLYRIALFPHVVRGLVSHTVPFTPVGTLSWAPQGDFTGLVVYAGDALPVWGESVTDTANPSIFPRLFSIDPDRGLVTVLERGVVDPERLTDRGMVAFTDDFDERPFRDRIGDNPLRIAARAVFGINRTDLIISADDAGYLLSSTAGLRVLREGRVLVIVNPSRIRENVDF